MSRNANETCEWQLSQNRLCLKDRINFRQNLSLSNISYCYYILVPYMTLALETLSSHSTTPPSTLYGSKTRYLVGRPNAILSSDTKYGPAKSLITPFDSAIPMCPMNGKKNVSTGIGVHTIQNGYLSVLKSICAICAPWFTDIRNTAVDEEQVVRVFYNVCSVGITDRFTWEVICVVSRKIISMIFLSR